jgi:hypothetical protein
MGYSENLRKKLAARLLKKSSSNWIEVNLSEVDHPIWMTRCFRNNKYVVMINDECMTTHGYAIRAMVQKNDDTPILNHWREIQNIKNELFGEEVTAIEYYPAESNLQDLHNIYWLWIYPDGVLPIPV